MKQLTDKQNQIIASITEEFNRINESNIPSGSFNLIDIDGLNRKNRENAEDRAMIETDRQTWEKMAIDEANTIVELLKKDLPPYIKAERKPKSVYPEITIYDHDHKYIIGIMIKVIYERVELRHDFITQKGKELRYCFAKLECCTKEELFQSNYFTKEFRKLLKLS